MAEVGQGGLTGVDTVNGLARAVDVARAATLKHVANGIAYVSLGETQVKEADLERMIQAVPVPIASALGGKAFYFVPLALAEGRGHRGGTEETMVAPMYTAELAEEAICHRNVTLPGQAEVPAHEGVFISARLLNDQFALCFEYFINVAHAFAEQAGVPAEFSDLVWTQAVAEVRGETSQDAFEAREAALKDRSRPDEKARGEYMEYAFSDALAIYQLSLAVDFDYSELREREYALLAPVALAERLRLVAKLFPPNPGYEFAIRYRKRA